MSLTDDWPHLPWQSRRRILQALLSERPEPRPPEPVYVLVYDSPEECAARRSILAASPMRPIKHGTYAGYKAHRYRRQKPCPECRRARSARERERLERVA